MMPLVVNGGVAVNKNSGIIRKSRRFFKEPKGGFEQRIVRYEQIHGIRDKDFDELVRIMDLQTGDMILDAGSGYGSVSREILHRSKLDHLEVILYDLYEVQLVRGVQELRLFLNQQSHGRNLSFVHGDLRKMDLPDKSVDKIAAKMVIHEIPVEEQILVFQEFFRVLRPGGKLVIWDVNVNEKNQQFFQEIVRMKDALANYSYLSNNRYFLQEKEMKNLAVVAGFNKFKKEYSFDYHFDTSKRLNTEFGGDCSKLHRWNAKIVKLAEAISKKTLKAMNFENKGQAIEFTIEKAIFTCFK